MYSIHDFNWLTTLVMQELSARTSDPIYSEKNEAPALRVPMAPRWRVK